MTLLLADLSAADVNLWVTLAMGLVIVIGFFKPAPALHKQFADKEDTSERLEKIESKLDTVLEKQEQGSGKQYDARRRMHRQLNSHGNAIYFILGKMETEGDNSAKSVREMLTKGEEGE
jgi:biopolymer transport protein ExbB/TolQ